MCVITAYGVQCLGCCLSEVRCRTAGYASGMRDVARRAAFVKNFRLFMLLLLLPAITRLY